MVEENPDFAFYSRDLFNKSFIPSQFVKGSNSELVIIHLDDSIIEISRTSRFSDPLIVRLNGEVIDMVEHNEKKEISFQNSTGNHLISVWNARAKNYVFSNFISKKGLAVIIDNVPVQNTMADPIKNLDEGRIAIWGLVGLISLKIIISFILNTFAESSPLALMVVLPYLLVLILLLYAGFVYAKNPRRAVLFGLVLGGLETIDFIAGIILNHSIGGTVLFFLLLRTSCLFALFRTLTTINKLLASRGVIGEDPVQHQEPLQKPLRDQVPLQHQELIEEPKKPKVKKEKKYLYSFFNAILKKKRVIKYSLITLLGIIVLSVGSYLLMQYISRPNFERDSSIAFRTDLKLPDLIPYRVGDQWGYCDKNKNIIISPQFTSVALPDGGDRLIINKNGLYGLTDRFGNKIVPYIYDEIFSNKHNFFIVTRNDLKGVIDSNGNNLVPIVYSRLQINKSTILAEIDYDILRESFCIYNLDGNILYESDKLISLCSVVALDSGKYYKITRIFTDGPKNDHSIFSGIYWRSSIINTGGKVIQQFKDESVPQTNNTNYVKVSDIYSGNNSVRFGIINEVGDLIIPMVYDKIDDNIFVGDSKLVAVEFEGKWGVVNSLNRIIAPFKYEECFIKELNNHNTFIFAHYQNKYGVLNSLGEISIPFYYDDLLNFRIHLNEDDLICAKKNNKWGYIDYENNVIIPFIFDSISDEGFKNGLTKVMVDDKGDKKNIKHKWGLINRQGKAIIPIIYDKIQEFDGDYVILKYGNKLGVINSKNQVVISFKYDSIHKEKSYDLFKIMNHRKEGYVDLNGKEYFKDEANQSE